MRQRQLDWEAMARNTADLRSGAEPRWQRLRGRLEGEGLDPANAVVARLDPDDVALEVGTVLTRDGRGFAFTFDFLRDEEGNSLERPEARVTHWQELSGGGSSRDNLELGREFLLAEQSEGA